MILYYIDTYILLLLLFYIILYRYRALIATDTRNILTGRKHTGGRWDFLLFFLTASKTSFLELIYYVYLLGKQHNMSPLRRDSSSRPKWGSQLYHRSRAPFPALTLGSFHPQKISFPVLSHRQVSFQVVTRAVNYCDIQLLLCRPITEAYTRVQEVIPSILWLANLTWSRAQSAEAESRWWAHLTGR